jgi:hypothetical protein
LRFSSLSFGGALLGGLAIIHGLEGVVNIFNHVNEAVSAAKVSHRDIELSSGEELFLVFQVCLHKRQGRNQLLRS